MPGQDQASEGSVVASAGALGVVDSPRLIQFGVLWFLVAAITGVAGGLTLHFMRGRFDYEPPTFANPTAEQSAKYNRERQAGLRRTAAASTGVAGAVFGAGFGLAFGLAARSLTRGAVCTLLAVASSAVLVGCGGLVSQIGYTMVVTTGTAPPLIAGSAVQFVFWFPLAVALTVAAIPVIPAAELARTAAALVTGAFVASIAVPISSVMLFLITLENSRDVLPPDKLGHCLLMGVVGSIALCAVFFAVFRGRRSLT